MPDEDKNFGGALVLDFRKRWRHVKTIYSRVRCHTLAWTGDSSYISGNISFPF